MNQTEINKKTEDEVISLNLAQELKTLGVTQISYFGWIKTSEGKIMLVDVRYATPKNSQEELLCAAYTNKDIDVFLSKYQDQRETYYEETEIFSGYEQENGFFCGMYSHGIDRFATMEYADKPGDAKAKMLIELIKKGHIKVKEL